MMNFILSSGLLLKKMLFIICFTSQTSALSKLKNAVLITMLINATENNVHCCKYATFSPEFFHTALDQPIIGENACQFWKSVMSPAPNTNTTDFHKKTPNN